MELRIHGVRCFSRPTNIPLSQLTVLVGENSSGKSTILALLDAVSRHSFPYEVDFNRPPFTLGNYSSIASSRRGRGHVDSFSIGYALKDVGFFGDLAIEARYAPRHGLPELDEVRVTSTKGTLVHGNGKATITLPRSELVGSGFEFSTPTPLRPLQSDYKFYSAFQEALNAYPSGLHRVIQESVFQVAFWPFGRAAESIPIAPIRVQPRRTYDQLRTGFEPEGAHALVFLDRLLHADPQSPVQPGLREALQAFGKDSGLFSSISTKRFGNQPGVPFQVYVRRGRRATNLIDVGYGVSQALPVLVQGALNARGERLLVQQPEVHLHPKAQASMGTFFFNLAIEQGISCVIETHSDYLIDRIRYLVAKQPAAASNATVIFCEAKASHAVATPIRIDETGSLVSPPRNYRRFFRDEHLRLLSRG